MKEFELLEPYPEPDPDEYMIDPINLSTFDESNDKSVKDNMNFWSLLAISFIEILCGFIFVLYRYAHYSHAGDNKFGRTKIARVSVTLGMFMWVIAILWVPVDCLLSAKGTLTRSINYYALKSFETFQLFYIWFICPIFLAYYESDENEPIC